MPLLRFILMLINADPGEDPFFERMPGSYPQTGRRVHQSLPFFAFTPDRDWELKTLRGEFALNALVCRNLLALTEGQPRTVEASFSSEPGGYDRFKDTFCRSGELGTRWLNERWRRPAWETLPWRARDSNVDFTLAALLEPEERHFQPRCEGGYLDAYSFAPVQWQRPWYYNIRPPRAVEMPDWSAAVRPRYCWERR